MRSKQSIGWAKKAATAPSSAAGYDDAIPASKTRRIFVYVIGGITHRWVRGCLSPMILASSPLYKLWKQQASCSRRPLLLTHNGDFEVKLCV